MFLQKSRLFFIICVIGSMFVFIQLHKFHIINNSRGFGYFLKSESSDSFNRSAMTCDLEEQKIRKHQIASECTKYINTTQKVTSDTKVKLVMEPSRTIAYCHVPKIASTAWMLGLAKMNGFLNETDTPQRLIDNEEMQKLIFNELLRPSRSLVFDPGSDKRILSRSRLFTFIFIRHPFERLVSAYEDKFVENKNPEFINDVLNHNRMNRNDHRVSFGQFVNFVIDELLMDTMSEGSLHWWPYSKLCRICDIKYSFIGRLETFSEDVRCVLDRNKDVPDIDIMLDILSIGKINGSKDRDTNIKTKEYMSKLPKASLNMLLELYKEDLDLGGYTWKDYG